MPDRPRVPALPRSEPPHRLFFAGGLLLLTLAGLWWALVLLARHQSWPLSWGLAPGLAHGLLFGLGPMPLFIAGFFFTAGPRWLRVPAPAPEALRRPLVLMGLGWAGVLAALHGSAALAGLGLLTAALGWGLLCRAAGRLLAASRVEDCLHLRGVLAAWRIGVGGMAAAGLALLASDEVWARRALHASLWWSLLPIFLLALHRMVPMFAEPPQLPSGVGMPGLPDRSLLCCGLAGCAWAGAWDVLVPPVLPVLPAWLLATRAWLEGGGTLLLLIQAWRWRSMMRLPLMAMLLCGGLWLALGLGLSALAAWSAAGQGGRAGGPPGLGLAPLHAVLAGGLGSLLMAQVSRISSAHAGRTVAVDGRLMALFLLLQLAVLLRLWGALDPSAPVWLMTLAALLWGLAMGGWAWRLLGWMRRPRAV